MKSLVWQEQNTVPVNGINHNYPSECDFKQKVTDADVLNVEDLESWGKLVEKSLKNALSGLSALLEHELKLNSITVKQMPVSELNQIIGKRNTQGIGTYLSVEGEISGQVMLIHTPSIAFQLIDLLLDLPQGTSVKLGNLERMALEEIGNITGTYFLNTMADNAGLIIMPSPPEVVVDTMAAIMSIPVKFIEKRQTQAVLVESTFSADYHEMDGSFIALPTTEFIKAVTKRIIAQ
ncbi:MAG: hypothetical protein JW712_03045 [Dehalococcoidales bacterium]|nr:hypothetical protein [Dehalococcoidales bacterium]